MDLLNLPEASMQTFTFHGWLVVEIFTDDGLVGIGNAALAPQVTKQVIDLYLKPLLIGKDPWDIEFLWQHMYRKTMAFGRRGIGMVRSAQLISRCGTCWVNRRNSLSIGCEQDKPRIPVVLRLYSVDLNEVADEAAGVTRPMKAKLIRLGTSRRADGVQRNQPGSQRARDGR